MPTLLLYLGVALVWGSTWLAITFQLGVVDPLVSVIYRFGSASALLFVWCLLRRIPLKLTPRQHAFMLLQGSFLFGLNYWILYLAAQHVTSGLIAATFATIVFLNAFNARLWLQMPIKAEVLQGGVAGIAGVALLFSHELQGVSWSGPVAVGLGWALLSTLMASLGNITAAHNTSGGRSVMAINAWGMLYGTLTVLIIALLLGVPFTFDTRPSYLLSLGYLVVFGSILTFAGYLRLITVLGPDKAAYMSMLVPIIALTLSSIFEGYQWSLSAFAGLALVLAGNWWAMGRRRAP